VSGAPLDGLRVLEISSFVASPLCGLTLAQLGAEVIRIDPIGGAGDQHRWPLARYGTHLLDRAEQDQEIGHAELPRP